MPARHFAQRVASALMRVALMLGGPAASAARLDAYSAPLLHVVQWLETNAEGRQVDGTVTVSLQSPGSTGAGLQLGTGEDPSPDPSARPLTLPPLPWRDPAPGRPAVRGAAWDDPSAGGSSASRNLAALLDQAARHCAGQAPALAAQLTERLRRLGVAEAWFNFRQQLVLAGRPRSLSWDLHVDRSGGWFATTPLLDHPAERTLRVRYTSRSAATGLPPGVRLADGGWLRWQVEDRFGHPLAAVAGRDTGGAFDGPDGLRCLLGQAGTSCGDRQTELRTLQDTLGASRVELTVAGPLRPHFLVDRSAHRYALATLHVDRWIESADGHCSGPPWRYVNAYQASFVLDAHVERYSREVGQGWQRQAALLGTVRTPMQDWTTRSVALDARTRAGLDGAVIDPEGRGLIPLAAFPAGIEQVEASPIGCRAGSPP